MSALRQERRFVRELLKGGEGRRDGRTVSIKRGSGALALEAGAVQRLLHAGVAALRDDRIVAGPAARSWLTRQALGADDGAVTRERRVMGELEHREGAWIDLAESPLMRLARPVGKAKPFLEAHQVEAGERLRVLAHQARLNPRVTLSYDPTRSVSGRRAQGAPDATAAALDARRALSRLLDDLPDELAGVVLDVCGLLKGLQQVESERGWPRRSAKLVLRLGLDLLARRMGLSSVARGPEATLQRGWLEERASDWGV